MPYEQPLKKAYFLPSHILLLDDAVRLAEDIISDYFSLTTDYWIRNPYEVRTLRQANTVDTPERVYAHLTKYGKILSQKDSGTDDRYLYRIQIYDHRILEVTQGLKEVLRPFLVYIMTHELVHITRFSRFECLVDKEDKVMEEEKVHNITNKILSRVPIPRLGDIIEFFKREDRVRLAV